MKKLNLILVPALCALLSAACNQSKRTDSASAPPLPHGGTPVQVGGHDYHLELVNNPAEGSMTAYVLDAHAEKAAPVAPTPFELIARVSGAEQRLAFQPVTNASAATVTAFIASAEWLKTATNFDGEIPRITLGDETFESIKFSYPKGVRHIH